MHPLKISSHGRTIGVVRSVFPFHFERSFTYFKRMTLIRVLFLKLKHKMLKTKEQLTNSLFLEIHFLTYCCVIVYWRYYSCSFVSIFVIKHVSFDRRKKTEQLSQRSENKLKYVNLRKVYPLFTKDYDSNGD